LIVEINYLTYSQINKTKWDACIGNADNGLIYAYSFYLDAMAKNWDGLVLNDHEAVMPLTWNKKYGIYYLYQPAFTACLGIFGRSLTAETVNDFLKAIPGKFKYWDICLNHGNFFKVADFDLYERMNYVLNLNDSYDNLYNAYRDNIKRNIKKSEKLQLKISKNIAVTEVIKLSKEQASRFSSIQETDLIQFEKLFHLLYGDKKATTYGVHTKDGKLIASAVFFFSHNRAYYIMVGNDPIGKTLGASHALINAFIKDHAGEKLMLDFEGSDISSLAFFYSSFGAVEEKYSAVKLNKLPAAIKWLKK
jgi:hypothetical protein